MRLRLLVAALCAGILAGAPRVWAQHRERGGYSREGPHPGHCTLPPATPLDLHPGSRLPPSSTYASLLIFPGLPKPSATHTASPKLHPVVRGSPTLCHSALVPRRQPTSVPDPHPLRRLSLPTSPPRETPLQAPPLLPPPLPGPSQPVPVCTVDEANSPPQPQGTTVKVGGGWAPRKNRDRFSLPQ